MQKHTFSVANLILLSIIITLLYNRYRIRQENSIGLAAKDEIIRRLAEEKEWLLKEIHHRVKNNLQIVMSLLNSQLAYLENDAAMPAIRDIQHRVHAISLIHQKLYHADNISTINMAGYIHEQAAYLAGSYNITRHISFELNLTPVELGVTQAVPLGLILNEAITNAIKHAFPGKSKGQVFISLQCTQNRQVLLTIADNGIGLPENFSPEKTDSLGMSLMQGLSHDLNGTFHISGNNGTVVQVSFRTGSAQLV